MAGIGFRLKEIAEQRSLWEWLQLYAVSTAIFSGPWLISIVALGILSALALPAMLDVKVRLFVVTVVYVYCFSMISTGLLQLVLTRFVSDKLHVGEPHAIGPTLVGVTSLTAVVQSIVGAVALYFADVDPTFKFLALGLYVTMSIIWFQMLLLSAAKDYGAIVLSFLAGHAISFGAALVLGRNQGTNGLLAGFLAGQVVLLTLLMHWILVEFKYQVGIDFSFLRHFKKYGQLAAIGLVYNLAIWIDKIIYWFSPSGTRVHSIFHTHFPYDSAMFLAFLTIVPTISIFMLKVETDFFHEYRGYYRAITRQFASLDQIVARKRAMREILVQAFKTSLLYQGLSTATALLLMPYLLALVGIDPKLVAVFRIATLGAFFHAYLMVQIILLLYFDFRGSALAVSSVFLAVNGGLSLLTAWGPDWSMGLGYLTATFVGCITALLVFRDRFSKLEYLTFMRQPIG